MCVERVRRVQTQGEKEGEQEGRGQEGKVGVKEGNSRNKVGSLPASSGLKTAGGAAQLANGCASQARPASKPASQPDEGADCWMKNHSSGGCWML